MLITLFFVFLCAALWAASGLFGRISLKKAHEESEKTGRIPDMTDLLAAVTPIVSFFLIEFVSNDALRSMPFRRIAENILYLAVLFLLLFCILPWKRVAIGLFWIAGFLFGAMNHYLAIFRGNPLMPTDIFSVGTALQVAGGYEFTPTKKIVFGALLCLACIVFLCVSPRKPAAHGKKRLIGLGLRELFVVACMAFLLQVNIGETCGIRTKLWDVQKAYNKAGAVLSFADLTQRMQVAKPEGYDRESTNELLESYDPVESEDSAVRPMIIAVMVEAFSDLRAMGDFEVPEEYLENWYARTDYLYRGNCYVSVLGGNTANSEFEFLTGNSMGFLPSVGILPYQSYSMKNVGNLASILEEDGYLRTAFHPANKKNWNRQSVYNEFGFERFLGKKDVENPVRIRNRISDACNFEKLIELYEENRGRQQFLFNVTMQNHGGYEIEDMEGQQLIQTKEGWEKYTDLTTYLTLMRESDKAIEELISYFESVDEPVILCIFGDHQPSLDREWRESVLGKSEDELTLQEMQKKYVTPYLIWANYDTGIAQQETDLSANYLGALLLDAAGIQGSAYTNFLLDMRQYVPAINAFGYMTTDGVWHSMDEKTEASEWIDEYRKIEYNAMFDSGRDSAYYR